MACVPEASAGLDLCSLRVDQGPCRGSYQVGFYLRKLLNVEGLLHDMSQWIYRDFITTARRVDAKNLTMVDAGGT